MKAGLVLALGLLFLPLTAAAQFGNAYTPPAADATARASAAAAAAAAASLKNALRHTNLWANAEVGNVIAVDVATMDAWPNAIEAVSDVMCEVRLADGSLAASTAWRLAETGAGSELSTTAKSTLFLRLAADGTAQVSVTDVAGGSGATVRLLCTPLANPNGPSGLDAAVPAYVALTFDGV